VVNERIDQRAFVRVLVIGGLGVLTVGLVGAAIFLDRLSDYPLPVGAAITTIAIGMVFVLIGGQLAVRPPRVVSLSAIFLTSLTRSGFAMVLIGAALIVLYGERFAFDVARLLGSGYPVVVAADVLASKMALKKAIRES
jgi:hypothetical protein